MKRFYLYVPDGDRIKFDSPVIWLQVGMSQRDQVKLTLLENYAMDCDQFLRMRDDDTDAWLDAHAARLFPESKVPRLHFISCTMTIAECYRMVINGTLDTFARNCARPSNFLSTLIHLNSNFMRNHGQSSCMTSCPRGKRKYLSHSVSTSVIYALMPLWLILGVGLVDVCGERVIELLLKL